MLHDWNLGSMFLLGLLGTGHCLGMCGPLVLALLGSGGRGGAQLLYHLGRIATYTIVGTVVGAISAGARAYSGNAPLLGTLATAQVLISLCSAALLLLFGLVRLGILREPAWLAIASPARIPGFSSLQRRVAAGRGGVTLFGFGMMLGLLPCGLSLAAFAAALTASGAIEGALWLAAFGAGTLPGLLLLGTVAARYARRYARLFEVLAGLLLIGMAASLSIDALAALL